MSQTSTSVPLPRCQALDALNIVGLWTNQFQQCHRNVDRPDSTTSIFCTEHQRSFSERARQTGTAPGFRGTFLNRVRSLVMPTPSRSLRPQSAIFFEGTVHSVGMGAQRFISVTSVDQKAQIADEALKNRDLFSAQVVAADSCAICMESPEVVRRLDNCGHRLCADCLTSLLRSGHEKAFHCPYCRSWMLHTPKPPLAGEVGDLHAVLEELGNADRYLDDSGSEDFDSEVDNRELLREG